MMATASFECINRGLERELWWCGVEGEGGIVPPFHRGSGDLLEILFIPPGGLSLSVVAPSHQTKFDY